MIGGSQVASWRIYPRVHKDPGSVGHRAGVGQQTGERAKLSMDHPIEFLSVHSEEMALADGAAKLQALKAQLTRTTCRFGDGRWYGFNKRDTHSHEGAQLEANRASAARKGPLNGATTIGATLFPSEDRAFATSSFETMRPDLYLDRQLMRSRQAGGRKKRGDDDQLRIAMPNCFSEYAGGRSPVE